MEGERGGEGASRDAAGLGQRSAAAALRCALPGGGAGNGSGNGPNGSNGRGCGERRRRRGREGAGEGCGSPVSGALRGREAVWDRGARGRAGQGCLSPARLPQSHHLGWVSGALFVSPSFSSAS